MWKVTSIVAVLCLFIPVGVQAQSSFQTLMPPGLPSLSEGLSEIRGASGEIPGLASLNLAGIKLNPYAEVGFTHVGANFTLPIGPDEFVAGAELRIGSLEATFLDLDCWTGTVGINAILSPRLVVFGSATGFAPHQMTAAVKVPVSLGPIFVDPTTQFTVSNFEFWALGCGIAYGIGPGTSLLIGSTWDHTSLKLVDPREGGVPSANQTLRGNGQLETWTPFLGLQIVQPNYNASIIYSPYTYGTGQLAVRSNQTTPTQLMWDLRQPGQSFVFAAEYELPRLIPIELSLAFNAAWSKVKGESDLEFSIPGTGRNRTSDAEISKYVIGGGIKASIIF